jgi:hypothetical protein
MKLVPLTVRVNAVPPVLTEVGESEVMDATGFGGGGGLEVVDDEPPQADSPISNSGISQS